MASSDLREVTEKNILVKGADNKNHELLIVPKGKRGVTISVRGTAGSATVNVGHMVAGEVNAYADATIAVDSDLGVYTGEKAEVYVIIASATASTDLGIQANVW